MRLIFALSIGLFTSLILPSHAATNPNEELKKFKQECIDYYRRPVMNIRNDSLNDVAFADFLKMRGRAVGPMIILNIKRLKKLTKASQLFFVAHECGHHALGHLYFQPPGVDFEQEADCYALRLLIRQGDFTMKDIKNVQEDMQKFAQASVHHRDGVSRAKALLHCME